MIGTTRSRVSFFMNRFRKLGLIEYNGRIRVHKSLINVILHDQFTGSNPENFSESPKLSAAPRIRSKPDRQRQPECEGARCHVPHPCCHPERAQRSRRTCFLPLCRKGGKPQT